MLMDEDGNTKFKEAREWLRKERQHKIDTAPTSLDVDMYLVENAVCPRESLLTLTGAMFPKLETMD